MWIEVFILLGILISLLLVARVVERRLSLFVMEPVLNYSPCRVVKEVAMDFELDRVWTRRFLLFNATTPEPPLNSDVMRCIVLFMGWIYVRERAELRLEYARKSTFGEKPLFEDALLSCYTEEQLDRAYDLAASKPVFLDCERWRLAAKRRLATLGNLYSYWDLWCHELALSPPDATLVARSDALIESLVEWRERDYRFILTLMRYHYLTFRLDDTERVMDWMTLWPFYSRQRFDSVIQNTGFPDLHGLYELSQGPDRAERRGALMKSRLRPRGQQTALSD